MVDLRAKPYYLNDEDIAWVETHKPFLDALREEKNRHIEATGFIVDSQLRTAKRLRLNKWK